MGSISGIGNIPNYSNVQAAPGAATSASGANTSGGVSSAGGFGSLLSGVMGTAANVYGSQNAAESQTQGINAGITTQQNTMGNINSIYNPQSNLGNGAFNALGSALGTNGQPANYSNFLNMPGYQFAQQQGTQAIQRAATAQGNAYTPNTMAAVGQYVTGTAMQDYNTYIQQLMGAGSLGAQANQGKAGAQLETGTNISQLQQNSGTAQAGGQSGAAGAISSFLGGPNGSGVLSAAGGLLSKGYNALTGGSGNGSNYITGQPGYNTGVTTNNNFGAPTDYSGMISSDQSLYNGANVSPDLSGLNLPSDF